MDLVTLSRVQFALTIAFHYIFPPLSIGLGWILVMLEGMYLKTGDIEYHHLTKFFVSIFALIFGLGVATGLVMEFEFGTNWANYARYVGDIFGSAIASEGLFAFFLESGFLAVLVFGWNRVNKWVHFISTLMVALGATFSAVWIVVINSWMHTPQGFKIVQNDFGYKAEITDFWAMVFNPSAIERLSHVLFGSLLTGATLVLSIAAWYLLKNRFKSMAKKTIMVALIGVFIGSFGQLVTGHFSAKKVAETQPAKLAAFEGHYHSEETADLYLFGWVDEANETVHGLKVPGGLSFLLHENFSTKVTGLDQFEHSVRPPVNFIFQTYHLMIAIGMGLIGFSLLSAYLWWKGSLFKYRWYLWMCVAAVMGPQIANQVGWYSAEVGRQPWVVYGLLKTKDAVSEMLTTEVVLSSVILFGLIYLLLFIFFIYLLNDKIQKGPMYYSVRSRRDSGILEDVAS